ncbi:TetR family transcriptional regulator [Actinocatenispora thailandica]|uniref:TetR family transcriptional regulator n=1 Tax=Actinocatenispora thailandica TaxID=227318 RepID=A0A7R7HZQ6_9ACTN|nr:TetR/AcrR family transcriptional regulator [Actinocatenispora thailandica]BCJ38602.1 TetR family transcriptional regulator [Actinocatenispora thailandica]
MTEDRTRGRPRDPAVDEAALSATLTLLDEHGYERLHVADVARAAGIGLGSLYRRWPTKHALVVAALRAAAEHRTTEINGDPVDDLTAHLVSVATAIAERAAPLLSVLLSATGSDLAAAVREAKVAPIRAATRERLRPIADEDIDLTARADAGLAMILLHLMIHGAPPDEQHIRSHILPIMTTGSGST